MVSLTHNFKKSLTEWKLTANEHKKLKQMLKLSHAVITCSCTFPLLKYYRCGKEKPFNFLTLHSQKLIVVMDHGTLNFSFQEFYGEFVDVGRQHRKSNL